MIENNEEILKQLSLLMEIENGPDRSIAIVGAAWLDEEITKAISVRFPEAPVKIKKKLFDAEGPLATFASKIDMALFIGIISEEQHRDLHLVRKVRNEFAHKLVDTTIESVSFSTQEISDRCLSIKCVAKENPKDARTAFIRACYILYSDLYLDSWERT